MTGYSLADCLAIVTATYGPDVTAPLTLAIENPDLTDFQPTDVPLHRPLGVPVWRGIWYPPENLAGPLTWSWPRGSW